MRHRWFWELHNGLIPDGYEIDHKCKNRRCCNIEHLQCLDGNTHAIKGNEERYEDEFQEFKKLYLSNGLGTLTQKEMADVFNRSQPCICKWIQRVNKEGIN